jgi:hypothetical protein
MVDFGDWMKDRYTMNTFQPEKNDLRGAKKDLPLRPQGFFISFQTLFSQFLWVINILGKNLIIRNS